jgi:NAD(P)-dependent dehydrogenase (short-subunit alcohol dehydrogenase family)
MGGGGGAAAQTPSRFGGAEPTAANAAIIEAAFQSPRKDIEMGWSAADIPDQHGRTALVTGANSGIGLVAARELARAGAQVIMACRDTVKGNAAAETIRSTLGDVGLKVAALDLASLASVRAFAEGYSGDRLDLLINNAGVMAAPYRKTVDGFELQLGTNHLGHFALTGLLLDRLIVTPQARVVTISSNAHRAGRINFDDLQSQRSYGRWRAYGQSKLANLLFAFELDRRRRAAGKNLRSIAAHPGYAATNLQFAATPSRVERVGSVFFNRVFAQNADGGALPTLYAATADVPGGSFVGPDGFMQMRGHPRLVTATRAAKDPQAAQRLWQRSEQLTGVRFDLTAETISERRQPAS